MNSVMRKKSEHKALARGLGEHTACMNIISVFIC